MTQLTEQILIDRGFKKDVGTDRNDNLQISYTKDGLTLRLISSFSKAPAFEAIAVGVIIEKVQELDNLYTTLDELGRLSHTLSNLPNKATK